MDGDARGGAALSIRTITGKPIKFIGVGEKIDMLEPFYPERIASRILGMGDVLSLIEQAQKSFDQKEAEKLQNLRQKSEPPVRKIRMAQSRDTAGAKIGLISKTSI